MLNILILCDRNVIISLSRFSISTTAKTVPSVRRARRQFTSASDRDAKRNGNEIRVSGPELRKERRKEDEEEAQPEDFFLPRIRHREPRRRTFTFVINVDVAPRAAR